MTAGGTYRYFNITLGYTYRYLNITAGVIVHIGTLILKQTVPSLYVP